MKRITIHPPVPSHFLLIVRLVLLLVCLTSSGRAQTVESLPPDQIRQFVQQAQASGMTESQTEQLARSRGFTDADITRMRQRIQETVGTPNRQGSPSAPAVVTREQPPTPTPPVAATINSGTSPLPTVFGASLFSNASLSFEPNLRIPTPRNYQLGPDDELVIAIFGNAQQTYRPRVSPEGSIRIENLAPIYVSGLTIEQAEQRIVGRLRTLFQGLNNGGGIGAQVTLGSVRSISVTLLGQIVRPGTYTLSSLASVFNALYAAGGPLPDRGSFRDVRLYRANRLIKTLDIYDFLLRADQSANIRLHDQDIIFVDHYDTRIELMGQVRQPGLYEARRGETLRQLLTMAGGFADQAYTASVSLLRNTATGKQLLTVPANEIDTFTPKAGDQLTVGSLLNRVENKVTIKGAVFRPGDFALTQNPTLTRLIRTAEGLREDAFLNRATIRRLRDNLDPELISVDLGNVLRGQQPDMPLKRDDVVDIISVGQLRQKRTVSIQGAVNQPGSFPFVDSLTVANLIVLAGGFTDGAIAARLEIARRVGADTSGIPTGQNTQLRSFSIDRHLRLNPADAQLVLRPYDQVFVRTSPRYEAQKDVVAVGELVYPGSYAIRTSTDRIADLIGRAGGLKPDADLLSARFTRRGEVVSVAIQRILNNPSDVANLLLEDGDTLTIPRRTELVQVQGEVLNPATVGFDPAKSFRKYISEAGGFTSKAQPRKVYAIRANGKIVSTRSFLGLHRYPTPERGMTVVIPAEPPKEPNRLSATERAALLTVISSGAAVVLSVIRLFL
ncbi:SLBB domain-containing protein [uncultured Spirosoma sp.]|uniref:SLBB domain-containing protein n=1 Tax=uncultured Spirosoma sp. TaxID=278208 RepID=UPI00258C0AFF|nr:SLBB domain-containing protein [uncultured Spirosoma sp.]